MGSTPQRSPAPPSGPGSWLSLCSAMNRITVSRAGRARARRNRRCFQDLIGPTQLGDLLTQRLVLLGHLRRHTRAQARIDLRAAEPGPQRLRVPIPNMPATMRTARSRSSSGYLLGRPINRILPRSLVSGLTGRAHSDLPLLRWSCPRLKLVSAGQTGHAPGIQTCRVSLSGSLAPFRPHEMTWLPLTPLHHLQGYVVGHSVGFSQRPGARF